MNQQLGLFDAPTVRFKKRGRAMPAETRWKGVRQLMAIYLSELADAQDNLSEVEAHQRASKAGIIDENWWQGAMSFGIWHFEEETEYRMGNYPIKVVRWLRHLRFTLCAEAHAIKASIRELQPEYDALAALFPNTKEDS